MEPEGSLPCSQQPATCPYPEPNESTSPNPISVRSILMLSSHLRLGLPSGLLPSMWRTYILKLNGRYNEHGIFDDDDGGC
jgi:hypothetical protein